jgi:hypothetical protein
MRRTCNQCGRYFYDKGHPQECCPQCCQKSVCIECNLDLTDTQKSKKKDDDVTPEKRTIAD